MNNDKVELHISNFLIIRVMAVAAVFIIGLLFLYKISGALLLILVAFFLALALNSPVHWLAQKLPTQKDHTHRLLATVISFLVVVAVIGSFIAIITPPIVTQTKKFISTVPSLVSEIEDENSSFSRFVARYNLEPEVNDFSKKIENKLSHFTDNAVDVVTIIAKSIISVLTVLVLTFMMLLEGPRWLKYGQRLLPTRSAARANRLAGDMYSVVRGYVNGQVILAVIAALLMAPALFISHIDYPIALIFVVFICGLIPFVGHTLGAIIITVVALFHAPITALALLAYYVLYINIENYVIQPRLQSFTTNLTPLTVFAALTIGVSFGGVLGGLLSIPIAGCVRVLVLDYIERKDLVGDRPPKSAMTK